MAAGKLQEVKWIPQRPVTYPLQNVSNLVLLGLALLCGLGLVWKPVEHAWMFPVVIALALAFGVLLVSGPIAAEENPNILNLAGTWQFQLDRDDRGEGERWQEKRLVQSIRLPGSLQEQRFGDDVTEDTPWTGTIADRAWYTAPQYAKYRQPGNIKVPFLLQPEKYYLGAAWYQRDVEIPVAWRG